MVYTVITFCASSPVESMQLLPDRAQHTALFRFLGERTPQIKLYTALFRSGDQIRMN